MFIMEIIVNVIEAFLVYSILKKALPKEERRTRQIIGIPIIACIISVLNYMNMYYTVQIIFVLCIHISFAFLCFSGSSIEKILWGSSYMVIASLSERIAFKIGILFRVEDLSIFLKLGMERYALISVYLVIAALSVWVLTRIGRQKIDLPFSYQILAICFVCCSLAGADLLSDILILAQMNNLEKIVLYTDIIFVLILLMVTSLVYLVRKVSQIHNERNLLILERKKEEYLQKEYLSHKRMLEAIRVLKHDYSNHLQVLDYMVQKAELQKARDYVEDLRKNMDVETEICNSGDDVLDVIISAKIEEARKSQIKVDCSIILLNPLPLSEIEITSLFGNLFDNAIEANQEVPESERFIKLMVKPVQDDISLVMQNRFDGKLKVKEGEMLSRKENGDHGIGVKQIQKIVNAAEGYCFWETEEKCFTVNIILPPVKN